MAAKKEIKSHHTDIKDGPPLTKVVAEALKSKGSVKGAVEHVNAMSASELKNKLDKVSKEIAEKRASKKSSNSRSKGMSRGMPPFMQNMMDVKKEVKAKHTDIKDGPALSKVVSEALKAKGDVKGAIEHLNDMSASDLKAKLDKVNKEIAEKRAAKKSA
jgi:ribosomal protein L29